ncbi:MAG: hypothetical protein EBQ71_18415 [Betaproteobacteria bacterium]|nr:hypothetical protein [Betaproteobacteria bacterium]
MKQLRRLPAHIWAVSLAGLCASGCALADPARTLSSDEKLTAIRQGLVQAALEGPTEVQATQWIDAQGVLRESSAFRSGMQVRGVRVTAYGQDSQGQPNATLQWQSVQASDIKSGLPAGREPARACKLSGAARLQHVASIHWVEGSGWAAEARPLLRNLRGLLVTELSQASAASTVWRLAQTDARTERTAYTQALLARSDDDIPWQISFALQPIPVIARVLPFGGTAQAPSPFKAQLSMTLSANGLGKALLQLSSPLSMDINASNWQPAGLTEASQAQISQQAQGWARQLEAALSCQPVVAKVTQAMGSQIRINAGAAAGLRIGDEWLLADGQKIPERVLEASLSAHTVLARVTALSEHHAQLAPVAGSKAAVRQHWLAWSAEASP